MKPLVSVVIPTYNGWAYLQPCLASLRRQTQVPSEVIVVDNGSGDGTAAALAAGYPEVRVVALDRNEGFARACNRGAVVARHPYLWFLNNDTVVEPSCLERLLEALEADPQAAMSCGKLRVLGHEALLDQAGSTLTWTGFLDHLGLFEPDQGQYDQLTSAVTFPKGVSVLVRRAAFEAVGAFDEAFFAYFEETDLFWRFGLAGYRWCAVPSAVTYHHIGGTSAKLPAAFLDFHAYKNRLCALLKNLSAARLSVVLPAHILCCLGMASLHLLRGHGRSSAAILRALCWNVWHLQETLRKRRVIQHQIRRRSDREVFGPWGWRLPVKRFLTMVRWAVFARPPKGRLQIPRLKASAP